VEVGGPILKPIRIRRLNDEGQARFRSFIESQTGDAPTLYADARAWLTSEATTTGVSGNIQVDPEQLFERRFDMAEYLADRVPKLGLRDPIRDVGLWSWLALLWFEQLSPPKKRGVLDPGRPYRYIPELNNFQTYYRHRVLGPYLIFSVHKNDPERAICMLCQPPRIHPDTAEQLASRLDLIQSAAVVGTASRLYYDQKTRQNKKGATDVAGKVPKPGTLRRLVEVAWQFDRTYDHLACATDAFMSLLPAEFARFVAKAGGQS
jgi:hypothetical protein